MLLNTLNIYTSFTRLLEPLLISLNYFLINLLLLIIKTISKLNSYLLLLINALKDSLKELKRIYSLLYTSFKLIIISFNLAILSSKTRFFLKIYLSSKTRLSPLFILYYSILKPFNKA